MCVKNEGHELDLEVGELYAFLRDDTLETDDIRVIDETGEDYVYPAEYFMTAKEFERHRSAL